MARCIARIRPDNRPYLDLSLQLSAMTPIDDRLLRLETALAHTQHDLEQMHQALLGLHTELKSYRREITRLERRVASMGEPPEIRDPGEEQPPHY